MANIGFKTKEMKRQESLPVVASAQPCGQAEQETINSDNQDLAQALIRQRIRKQAMELVDGFLFHCILPDYTFAQLKKLKELVLVMEKD